MLLRRRMYGKDGSINADSYVQNGLVFQLDGIEWGNVAGHWIERKNGYDWYEANNVNLHTEDDAMVFDGTNYMFTEDTIPSYPYETCSIEICASAIINSTDSIPYINFSAGNVAALKRSGNSAFICEITTSGSAQAIASSDLTGITNISYNGDYYIDSSIYTGSATYGPTPGMRQSRPIIGNAYKTTNLSTYFLVGKIHSIRIYSRKLTSEEIAFNYNIDKQRFNV